MPTLPDLTVLYEDNHLLAVDKPAGMPVQGDDSGDESLLDRTREWIRIKYEKPGNVYCGLVHRLDRPASGVVIFAKTSKAASRLSEQFRNHQVKKKYLVVVSPPPTTKKANLTHYLFNDTKRRKTMVYYQPKPGLKKASLQYELTKKHNNLAELKVILETGRKHQIRAQLSNIGCSIVGDVKYGYPAGLCNGKAIALHAVELTVIHPTQKKTVIIVSSLPKYWPI